MTMLTEKQHALNEGHDWDFSDLRAIFISCTLKRSPEVSHTEGLAAIAMEIMRRNGVKVELWNNLRSTFARKAPAKG